MGKGIVSIGMMTCDTILAPVPDNILELDCAMIGAPVLACGGDAENTAIALAKLGAEVSLIGLIGNDANGRFLLSECAHFGVHTEGIVTSRDVPTACSYAIVDMRGERHFLSEISAFHAFSIEHVNMEMVRGARVVYLGSAMAMHGMNHGGITKIFREAKKSGALTVMDAAMNDLERCDDWMGLLEDAFRVTDIFFPSLQEAEALTGSRDPERIAESFAGFGMKAFGVKLGSEGSFVTDFSENRRIPCPAGLPVVDTSGAGDSFMAGLITGLEHGLGLFDSAAFGSAVASLNVGKKGATGGIPSFAEAAAFYHSWTGKEIHA